MSTQQSRFSRELPDEIGAPLNCDSKSRRQSNGTRGRRVPHVSRFPRRGIVQSDGTQVSNTARPFGSAQGRLWATRPHDPLSGPPADYVACGRAIRSFRWSGRHRARQELWRLHRGPGCATLRWKCEEGSFSLPLLVTTYALVIGLHSRQDGIIRVATARRLRY